MTEPYIRARKAIKEGTATKRRAEVISVRRDEHFVAVEGFDGILFRTKIRAQGKGNGRVMVAAGETYDVVVASDDKAPRVDFIQWIVVNDNVTIPPPPGCPCRFEPVPVHSDYALQHMVRSVISERVSDESIVAIAYLIRKAHGQGLVRHFTLESDP